MLADPPQGIEIIFDKTRQIPVNHLAVYASDADYFTAYTSLQAALKQQQNVRVIVYSRALKTWLLNGLGKYKNAAITARDVTYRDLLAAAWNISSFDIPLSDVQIQRQKLLDLPLENQTPQPLSSVICQALLSPYLDTPQCNTAHFGELLTDLLTYHADQTQLPGIVSTVYRERLSRWISTSPSCAGLIQELREQVWPVYEKCCLYKLTARYPEQVRIKCLGAATLRMLQHAGLHLDGLETKPFEHHSPLYESVLQQELTLFFHAFATSHPTPTTADLEKLLGYCSGTITLEIDALLHLLHDHVHLLTPALLTQVKTTFTPLLPEYHEKIEELRHYMPLPRPSPFPEDGDLQGVIQWAAQEYLPYKFWLETTRRNDPAVLAYGREFAEYIFEHYAQISYHYEHVLYRFLFNYKALIAATEVPILLVLDNFNYKFLQVLQDNFARYFIVPSKEIEPYLSLLPSETAISKKGLISGKRNQEDTIQYSYRKNLIDQWQEFFPHHTLTYLPKLGELDDYVVTGREFLVINYLEIDAELHKSYQKTAIEHRKTVAFYLDQITTFLARFIRRNHLEDRARVFLVSDHGSTLIPGSLPNDIEVEYVKRQAIESTPRFLTVNDAQFEALRQNVNLADALFFLGKDLSGDGNNYVIARGYNRFKDIQEDVYVHGGALPEEILLPVGCFEYRRHKLTPLILQLVKTEYRLLTRETLVLRVANPNEFPVQHLSINVFAQDAPLAACELPELGSLEDLELRQEIRIKHKAMTRLRCDLSYEAAGQIFQDSIECPITIKTMTQAKFDFDEW